MYDISNLFLFKDVGKEEAEKIAEAFTVRKFKKGDVIYDKSAYIKALGVFLSGKGIAITGNTEKNSFSEGSVFGAASMFGSESEYISRIEAKTAACVAFIPEELLRKLFSESSVFAENYISFLTEKIRFLNGKITHFTGGGSEDRLFAYLKDNSSYGVVSVKNMAELSKLVGLSRSQLYAAMDRLEACGRIEKDGKIVKIKEN